MRKSGIQNVLRTHILRISGMALLLLLIGSNVFGPATVSARAQHANATVGGCPLFPPDNIWNQDISALPTHANSTNYIANIGSTNNIQGVFGSGLYNGLPIGLPYAVVPGTQPAVPVSFYYNRESDPGPYPIPPQVPIEGGAQSTGDRHVIVVNSATCKLYEMYSSYLQSDGSWKAGSGAVWDLNSNALRPQTWTSADAAGLPMLAGFARYDEVAAGAITHALRFTVNQTQQAYVWPARHFASSNTNPNVPPMGLRLRLKTSVNIAAYPPQSRIVLTALQHYGMIVADNGYCCFISGSPDDRWNNSDVIQLKTIRVSDFDVVDESSLQVSPDSAQARGASPPTPTPTLTPTPAITPTHPPAHRQVMIPVPTVTLVANAEVREQKRNMISTSHSEKAKPWTSPPLLPIAAGGVVLLLVGGLWLRFRRSRSVR